MTGVAVQILYGSFFIIRKLRSPLYKTHFFGDSLGKRSAESRLEEEGDDLWNG